MSTRHRSHRVGARRGAVGALLALLLALALGGPAQAAEVPNHPFKATLIGGLDTTEKPPVSNLDAPCGVAVRPNGAIYVSDYYRRTIVGSRPA